MSKISFKVQGSSIFAKWTKIKVDNKSETALDAVNNYCDQLLGVKHIRCEKSIILKK